MTAAVIPVLHLPYIQGIPTCRTSAPEKKTASDRFFQIVSNAVAAKIRPDMYIVHDFALLTLFGANKSLTFLSLLSS